MSEILRTEHIVQRFGGMEALKDISMRVESGEIVGVIGPNGAGKTTLFNCITGMYCPTEGRVPAGGPTASLHRALRGRSRISVCFRKCRSWTTSWSACM